MAPRGGCLDVRIWHREDSGIPLLLVNASRKNGPAVDRNRFRRRMRMAFLELIRDMSPEAMTRTIVWVRPAKGSKLTSQQSFEDLKGQLKLALRRWTQP